VRTRKVNFADHALSHQRARAGFYYFRDKFVARRPGESVVPSLKLQIRITNAAH
jgi:hypothetical protein